MNMTVAFTRQSLFARLAIAMLPHLFKAAKTKAPRRYVNIGEFSPHLQRDMGFLDGRPTPGSDRGPGTRDLQTRDWLP